MAFGFSDLTPAGKRYFAELKKLAESEIQVGFQSDQTYEDGTSLAGIAAINELGSSDTPARPFMRQSFENHKRSFKQPATGQTPSYRMEERPSRRSTSLGFSAVGSYRRRSSKEALHRTQSRPSRRRGPTSR